VTDRNGGEQKMMGAGNEDARFAGKVAFVTGAARFITPQRPAMRYSARTTVTLKSSLWRSIASISASNSPIRTMPPKYGASLS
jgi:hypothetical protein